MSLGTNDTQGRAWVGSKLTGDSPGESGACEQVQDMDVWLDTDWEMFPLGKSADCPVGLDTTHQM